MSSKDERIFTLSCEELFFQKSIEYLSIYESIYTWDYFRRHWLKPVELTWVCICKSVHLMNFLISGNEWLQYEISNLLLDGFFWVEQTALELWGDKTSKKPDL